MTEQSSTRKHLDILTDLAFPVIAARPAPDGTASSVKKIMQRTKATPKGGAEQNLRACDLAERSDTSAQPRTLIFPISSHQKITNKYPEQNPQQKNQTGKEKIGI
ncbi:MAG TPA: hypothetical protein O0Y06_09880 [Methanocorpusculum sp.]|nr:hypothetical protein [Methanocorpusculum sp.]HJK81191.1 hypothetical protein [Methanocorpusculum sp.]